MQPIFLLHHPQPYFLIFTNAEKMIMRFLSFIQIIIPRNKEIKVLLESLRYQRKGNLPKHHLLLRIQLLTIILLLIIFLRLTLRVLHLPQSSHLQSPGMVVDRRHLPRLTAVTIPFLLHQLITTEEKFINIKLLLHRLLLL
jgi:hypothetical protein